MKVLLLSVLWLVATALGAAAGEPTIQSLAGREFSIADDWAGQELAFARKDGALVAVWRILGSGRPVAFEAEYPVETSGPRQCGFEMKRPDGTRHKVKIELHDHAEVRAYVNGIRIQIEEKRRS